MVWICLIVLAATLTLSFPIAMCLGISALVGILITNADQLVSIPQKFISGSDSFPLLAIPLFILAGQVMSSGGIARRIVDMAMVFVGRIRGGLGMVTVLATMLFSGISGSSSADTAAIGSITLPAMRRKGYPKKLATALVAAAGGTASLVPPSIDFIIIGVVAQISIGGLFIAGFLPGAINGLAIMGLVLFFGYKHKLPLEDPIPFKKKLIIIADGFISLLMAIVILGGILGGFFTPTEASAVAVIYGVVVSFFFYKEITVADIPKILLRSGQLTGIVMLVLTMATIFSHVLTFERIPHAIGEFIVTYSGNWIVFVIFVNVLFLFLGMIMDGLAALIVLMPIIVPAAVQLGMEPIHIGILCANNIGISMVSPPVGVCLYVACGLSDLPLEDIIKPMLPFLAVLLSTLIIISYVPAITLFFPRMFGYVGG